MPIISFLASAFSGILNFLFRVVVIKFLVFAVIYITLTEVLPIVIDFALSNKVISGSLPSISSSIGFYLQYFRLDVAVKLLISAYVTRFLIRRLPFVG